MRDRTGKTRALHEGVAQVSVAKAGAPQIGSAKIRLVESATGQIGAFQIPVTKRDAEDALGQRS